MPDGQWDGLEDWRAEYAFSHISGEDQYGHPNFDRALDDRDYANATSMLLTDGIAANDSEYFKAVPYNGMTVEIKRGFAVIAGTKIWKPTSYFLTLPVSSTKVNQRIVLRYDMRDTVRAPGIFALQGTPTPANNVDMKELVLADVTIRANTSNITAADIKDQRLNENLCGLVDYLYAIDVAKYFTEFDGVMLNLYNQMSDQKNSWIEYLQESDRILQEWKSGQLYLWVEWVDSLRDILSGETAGSLALAISDVERLLFTTRNINNLLQFPGCERIVSWSANSFLTTIQNKNTGLRIATAEITFLPDGSSRRTITLYESNGVLIARRETYTTTFAEDFIKTTPS